MLLDPDEAEMFFKLHCSLMCFVNERLEVVPGARSLDAFRALPADSRLKVRNALLGNMDLVELFVRLNPFDLSGEERNIVSTWKYQLGGKFFIFRILKKAAFDSGERKRLYKDARTFLKVRSMRNKLVKDKAAKANPGCPRCGYVGWLSVSVPLSVGFARRRFGGSQLLQQSAQPH